MSPFGPRDGHQKTLETGLCRPSEWAQSHLRRKPGVGQGPRNCSYEKGYEIKWSCPTGTQDVGRGWTGNRPVLGPLSKEPRARALVAQG